ncbi:rhodanese-like domain-containing protein [Siculibacillus lacustris]|uniref:Rhodanese-like domain-containing protein n=1 Tax=Siculibacillus lacustris TaxID=1549641 RepID=A0A4Q9VT34_9HYPH|nr:rhodanese-like domain-containing protein [Siculibacillus lacustris]TBW38241.1 rhodanese-like domain-containing protein [Siculibacillus lacustris]
MFGFGKSAAPIETLTPPEAHRRAVAGEILLVDVREAHEWAEGHVPGAHHAPLSSLATTVAAIPTDKPVVFYCLAGGRSAKAIELARSLGLPHGAHVGGGIGAWRAHGLPVER